MKKSNETIIFPQIGKENVSADLIKKRESLEVSSQHQMRLIFRSDTRWSWTTKLEWSPVPFVRRPK